MGALSLGQKYKSWVLGDAAFAFKEGHSKINWFDDLKKKKEASANSSGACMGLSSLG